MSSTGCATRSATRVRDPAAGHECDYVDSASTTAKVIEMILREGGRR